MKQKGITLILAIVIALIIMGYLLYKSGVVNIPFVSEHSKTSYSLDCEPKTNECSLFSKNKLINKFVLPEKPFSAYIYTPKNILAVATYKEVIGEDPINLYVVKLNENNSPVKIHSGYMGDQSPTEITNVDFSPSGNYLVIDQLDWELTSSIMISLTGNKELKSKPEHYGTLSPAWSPDEKHFLTYLTSDMLGYKVEYGTITSSGYETFELTPCPKEISMSMDPQKDEIKTYWNSDGGGIIEFKDGKISPAKYSYYKFSSNSNTLETLNQKPDMKSLKLSTITKQEKILQYSIKN